MYAPTLAALTVMDSAAFTPAACFGPAGALPAPVLGLDETTAGLRKAETGEAGAAFVRPNALYPA